MQPSRSNLLTGTAGLIGALALSACIPPAPEPTPAPSPRPTSESVAVPTPAPAPAPSPVAAPTYENWLDAPQTPGDWSYIAEPNETLAMFGTGQTRGATALIIRCDRTTRRVGIARSGSATGQVQMRIRTETQDRVLTAGPLDGTPGLVAAELSARDSLLDAIAFSKGRLAVETEGIARIYVPAYPEITRVVEDCRG